MTKTLPLIALLGFAASPCFSSIALETEYRTAGPAVHSAFEEVRDVLQKSSAVILRGRDEVIFGTVVSAEGHILTKASELGNISDLSVTVDRDNYSDPVLLVEDPTWDLALLKIDAAELVPVQLQDDVAAEQGTWVFANGATTRRTRRVQVGVVAANTREVFSKGGTVLGVGLEKEDDPLTIESVTEGSGAEEAGLKVGDVILSFEGEEIEGRKALIAALSERRVGEEVKVGIKRDGETMEVTVALSGRVDVFGEKKTRNDSMSGDFSTRRTGFPRVMQTDIMGNKHFMGGPVFDLEGRCLGMNIARFSRCETYAIPANDLKQIVDRMIQGKDSE